MKIILFSSSDDGYLHLLLDMMESLGDQLQKYDFGLLDLGISDEGKDKIRQLKPDVIFKKPEWFVDLPDYRKKIFSQAPISRPWIKEIFPNYDGYMQLDADLWLLDNSVIDDYIKAAEKTGFSIIAEWHPLLVSELYYKYKKFFGRMIQIKLKFTYSKVINNLFGKEAMMRIGVPTPICSGIYFILADSPVWEAWQESMRLVNWYKVKKTQRICDQTCLLYALTANKLPHTLMGMEHNWILFPQKNEPLLDKKSGRLLDPIYPHTPIKVIHLGGAYVNDEFTLKTSDGDTVKTKLTRPEFLKTIKESE